MAHTHIKPADWPVIARMLRAGYAGAEIARVLGKDPGAVNRHIAQHGGRNGYDVQEVRRRKRMTRIVSMDSIRILKGSLLRTAVRLLKTHHLPEQIAGALNARKKSELLPQALSTATSTSERLVSKSIFVRKKESIAGDAARRYEKKLVKSQKTAY
jgi:IS30 family transposase